MQDKNSFDLVALRKGDRNIFEAIYMQYSDMLLHICRSYLNNDMVAEEIVQDTFIKFWEVKEGLLDESNVKNYLFTIAKNKCLMYLRSEKAQNKNNKEVHYLEMQFNYEALSDMVDNMIEFEELKLKIDKALDELSPKLKEVFLLNRFNGLKYKEIAERLDVSVKTVEYRMSKSLDILRSELKDYLPILYLVTHLFNI